MSKHGQGDEAATNRDISAWKDRVQSFFGKHAAAYTASPWHRAGPDLELLIRLLAPASADRALDVATGTGHTALALAPLVSEVTGLDLTPEMGQEFTAAAERLGVANVRLVLGDAERLPFPDASFDIVTCRRAAHHFPDIAAAVAEAARVLRPGGRLGVSDMIAPDDGAAADLFNRMEIARDASHCRALSVSGWHDVVAAAGLVMQHAELSLEVTPYARWLYPLAVDGPEAAAALAAVGAVDSATAARVIQRAADGSIAYLKGRTVLVAQRPG